MTALLSAMHFYPTFTSLIKKVVSNQLTHAIAAHVVNHWLRTHNRDSRAVSNCVLLVARLAPVGATNLAPVQHVWPEEFLDWCGVLAVFRLFLSLHVRLI